MDISKSANYNKNKREKGGPIMGRKKDDKSRQEKRKEAFDQLLYVKDKELKDFYDYIVDGLEEIGKKKSAEKVFSKVMMEKLRDTLLLNRGMDSEGPKVEDYVRYIAQQLTEYTPVLTQWTNGKPWGLPMKEAEDGRFILDRENVFNIWLRTVKQWWEEDSFPVINEGRKNGKKILELSYEKRDVALFFLMVFDFSVSESDIFLEKLTLVKDSDLVRPLYALDFKECLFRWVLLWNENHDLKITYKTACDYYYEYGAWLINVVKDRMKNLFQEAKRHNLYLQDIFPYKRKENKLYEKEEDVEKKKKLYDKDFEEHLVKLIPKDASALYESEYAENLKRVLALCAHAERVLEEAVKEEKKRTAGAICEDKTWEFKRNNEHTRNRQGTEYAWSVLTGITNQEQSCFEEDFQMFKEYSLKFIGEAYWSQFSQLNQMVRMSDGYEPNRALIKNMINRKNNEFGYLRVKEALGYTEKNISFIYNGNNVQEILKEYTGIIKILSALQKPVRFRDAESNTLMIEAGSSSISQLMNSYHNWCVGLDPSIESPHSEFKRNKVLKVALASGAETYADLRYALKLCGNSAFQLMDENEAIVYLAANHHEKVRELWKDFKETIEDLLRNRLNLSAREKVWEKCKTKVSEFPNELGIEIPEKLESGIMKQYIPINTINLLQEWTGECELKIMSPANSLISKIREADFIRILYYTGKEKVNWEDIRKSLFYAPYRLDLKVRSKKKKQSKIGEEPVGAAEEKEWFRFIRGMYHALRQIFTDEGIKVLFSFAYSISEDVEIDTILGFNDDNNLAESYADVMEEELSEILEDKEAEEIIRASESEIREWMRSLAEIVRNSKFLYLPIPAIETRYILEQWTSMLSVLEYYDIEMSEERQVLNEILYVWKQGRNLIEAENMLTTSISGLLTDGARKWIKEYEIQDDCRLIRIGLWGDEENESRSWDFGEGYARLISDRLLWSLENYKERLERKKDIEVDEEQEWYGILKIKDEDANDQYIYRALKDFLKAMSACNMERQTQYSERVQELLEEWVCLTVVLENYGFHCDANQELLGQKLFDWLSAMDRIA